MKKVKSNSTVKEADLRDLFIQKLQALYDVEKNLVKALPKMAKASTNRELEEGFIKHLAETRTHMERLEQIAKILDFKLKPLKSEAIRGLVKDGEWVIKNVTPEEARDSNLARAAQYVEHYEMAGYMAAIDWANALGESEVADLLAMTLAEEDMTDIKLREIGSMLDQDIL